MLSNPNTNLHQRQRQHRRQNSTPTVFDAPKVPILPAKTTQRPGPHRRGLSVDHRSPQRRHIPLTPQDDITVSTNPGLQQEQQHTLREAQQHRLARPGLQQQERQQHLHYQTQGEQRYLQPQQRYDEDFNAGNAFSNDALCFDPQYQITSVISENDARRQGDNNRRQRERPLSYSGFSTKEIDDFLMFADGCAEHARGSQQDQYDLQANTPNTSTESGRYERRRSLQPRLYTQQQRPSTPQNASSKYEKLS